ncbi:TatD family hydrolase [Luteibaculum oceani]|uniref:TatD family deoxyribonuclease n=1 Tax=Luteibaculum oceani TaxID=1294296 RepID=A0A5C6UZT9_9FLAO|nr:TatD family hydrolase [Luteibaculum oceani]TXC78953.1 TatD family deoxyribonuclease [Luteibaculum oceani]
MILVDSHCHLYADQFNEDRDQVLEAAIKSGVKKIILPNIDRDSVNPMHELSNRYPENCFPMMGLHPCSVKENFRNELDFHKNLLYQNLDQYVGVGEIGIDLYWDKSTLNEQKIAFKEQCNWAIDLDLPIAIHVRDSFNEVFECLDEIDTSKLKGVFHCFSGNKEQAQKALSYPNFILGIGGVVTFKNSKLGATLTEFVPKEKLVVETDSPYLTPHPHRGKRNSPEYIPLIAQKLADLYLCSEEEIAEISTNNIKRMFPKVFNNDI